MHPWPRPPRLCPRGAAPRSLLGRPRHLARPLRRPLHPHLLPRHRGRLPCPGSRAPSRPPPRLPRPPHPPPPPPPPRLLPPHAPPRRLQPRPCAPLHRRPHRRRAVRLPRHLAPPRRRRRRPLRPRPRALGRVSG